MVGDRPEEAERSPSDADRAPAELSGSGPRAEGERANARASGISDPASAGAGSDHRPAPQGAVGEIDDLRFDCSVDAAYNASREAHYARVSRWLAGTQAFIGTGAVAGIVGQWGWITAALGVVAAGAAVAQLVFDPAGQARKHQGLRGRYLDILAEMEERPEPSLCAQWRARRLRIAADEEPVFRAIQAIAYNQIVDSQFPELEARERRLVIPKWDRCLKQFWRAEGRTYSPPE